MEKQTLWAEVTSKVFETEDTEQFRSKISSGQWQLSKPETRKSPARTWFGRSWIKNELCGRRALETAFVCFQEKRVLGSMYQKYKKALQTVISKDNALKESTLRIHNRCRRFSVFYSCPGHFTSDWHTSASVLADLMLRNWTRLQLVNSLWSPPSDSLYHDTFSAAVRWSVMHPHCASAKPRVSL